MVLILAYSVAFGVFAPMQFIFSSRVRNTYEQLRFSDGLGLPIVLTVMVASLDIFLAGTGGLQVG
jgi:hypothetical protein